VDANLPANQPLAIAGTAWFSGYFYFTRPASSVGWEVPR
jgi:hypothetical protein